MSILRILRLSHAEGLALPAYETAGSAGMDLRAAVPEDAPLTLEPGARVLVAQATVVEVDSLDDTARGTGGFGSTGR